MPEKGGGGWRERGKEEKKKEEERGGKKRREKEERKKEKRGGGEEEGEGREREGRRENLHSHRFNTTGTAAVGLTWEAIEGKIRSESTDK